MQAVQVHEETVILGTAKYRMDWLLRQMHRGIPGQENYESHHNLIFHFYGITDVAFPDRIRMAWRASGLNTKIGVEILPPIRLEGSEGSFSTESWDVILEKVDPCYAQAVKQSFVDALINAYRQPEKEEPAAEQPEAEVEEEFDPHGIGLHAPGDRPKQEEPFEYTMLKEDEEGEDKDAEEEDKVDLPYPVPEEEEDDEERRKKALEDLHRTESREQAASIDSDDDEDSEEALEAKEDPYSDDNYDPHGIGLQTKKKPEEPEKET
jgi:hypothetical protein